MSQLTTEYQVREQMAAMLFKDLQKPIELYLMGWVHNQEVARDLCQDTFLYFCNFLLTKETVVQSAAKYKVDLYTTAKNRAIDYLRKHNKPIVYLSQSESEANSWFDELTVEGDEGRICDSAEFQEVLAQLTQRQQQVVRLIDQGLNQRQIAAELGKSESRVSEILRDVRTQLQPKPYPAAHTLEQQVLFWYQDVKKLINCTNDDLNIFDTKLEPYLPEWVTFRKKSLKRYENGLIALEKSWVEIGSKAGVDLNVWLKRDEYKTICRSDLEFMDYGLITLFAYFYEPDTHK